jgi:hypothetical protein
VVWSRVDGAKTGPLMAGGRPGGSSHPLATAATAATTAPAKKARANPPIGRAKQWVAGDAGVGDRRDQRRVGRPRRRRSRRCPGFARSGRRPAARHGRGSLVQPPCACAKSGLGRRGAVAQQVVRARPATLAGAGSAARPAAAGRPSVPSSWSASAAPVGCHPGRCRRRPCRQVWWSLPAGSGQPPAFMLGAPPP